MQNKSLEMPRRCFDTIFVKQGLYLLCFLFLFICNCTHAQTKSGTGRADLSLSTGRNRPEEYFWIILFTLVRFFMRSQKLKLQQASQSSNIQRYLMFFTLYEGYEVLLLAAKASSIFSLGANEEREGVGSPATIPHPFC
jgi:hypothetical protein